MSLFCKNLTTYTHTHLYTNKKQQQIYIDIKKKKLFTFFFLRCCTNTNKMSAISGDIFLTWPSKTTAPSLKRTMRSNNTMKKDTLYTLLVVDRDAPYPDDPFTSPHLSYLRVNISANCKGDVLVKYVIGDTLEKIVHRYVAIVFIQKKGNIDIDDVGVCLNRECFALKDFVKRWDLVNYLQCFKLTH